MVLTVWASCHLFVAHASGLDESEYELDNHPVEKYFVESFKYKHVVIYDLLGLFLLSCGYFLSRDLILLCAMAYRMVGGLSQNGGYYWCCFGRV